MSPHDKKRLWEIELVQSYRAVGRKNAIGKTIAGM